MNCSPAFLCHAAQSETLDNAGPRTRAAIYPTKIELACTLRGWSLETFYLHSLAPYRRFVISQIAHYC